MSLSVSHYGIARYAGLAERPVAAAERIRGSAFLDPDWGRRPVEIKGAQRRDFPFAADRVSFSAEAEEIRRLMIPAAAKAAGTTGVKGGEADAVVLSMKKTAQGDAYEIADDPPTAPEEPSRAAAGFGETLTAAALRIVARVREEISLFFGGLVTDAPQEPLSAPPPIVERIAAVPRIDIRI